MKAVYWRKIANTVTGKNSFLEKHSLEDFMIKTKTNLQKTLKNLNTLIKSKAELFRTPDKQNFAGVMEKGREKIYDLNSNDFLTWIRISYERRYGDYPNDQALKRFIEALVYRTKNEATEKPVYLRVGALDGRIYLDLGDDGGHVVQIGPDGWDIITKVPIHFIRPQAMRPLPLPEHTKYGLFKLKEVINVQEPYFKILVGWLLMALNPSGPYPILFLQGEQGAAKSSAAQYIKAIIDPTLSPIKGFHSSERDLMIAAKNSWILAYDNVSRIDGWASDALCRLSTGAGLTTRRLYTDSDEVYFDGARPIILNSIGDIIIRNDLADRVVVVDMPRIPDEKRKTEGEIQQKLDKYAPRILGRLCTAVSAALKNLDRVQLDRLPRMADFLRWWVAAAPAYKWKAEKLIEIYANNRQDATQACFEADVVAQAVTNLMTRVDDWKGTASNLLAILENAEPDSVKRTRGWPKAPNSLSSRLRRAAPALRAAGIEVAFVRDGMSRTVHLSNIEAEDHLSEEVEDKDYE
jgi:hypothetical protein